MAQLLRLAQYLSLAHARILRSWTRQYRRHRGTFWRALLAWPSALLYLYNRGPQMGEGVALAGAHGDVQVPMQLWLQAKLYFIIVIAFLTFQDLVYGSVD